MDRTPLVKQLRFSSLMVGAGCAVAGTASAALHGNAEALPGILCVIFAVLAQFCANLYRRYYMENTYHGQPLGWKLPTRPATERAMLLRTGTIVSLILVLTVGFTLTAMGGWWVVFVGAFILVFGWFCAGGKHPLMRSRWSWVAAFILFGPVCVMSTAYIQIRHDATTPNDMWDILPAIFASAVMGLMAVNANLVYNYLDLEKDQNRGRESAVSVMGRKGSRAFFFTNGLLFSGIFIWGSMILKLDYPWMGIAAGVICFLINLYVWFRLQTSPVEKCKGLVNITNFNVLLLSLIMLYIGIMTGPDDESGQVFFGSAALLF